MGDGMQYVSGPSQLLCACAAERSLAVAVRADLVWAVCLATDCGGLQPGGITADTAVFYPKIA